MRVDLLAAAKALRAAQRVYMENRGNDSLGRIVAEKAAALDIAIEKAECASSEKAMRVVGKYGSDEHGRAWWNGLIELHHGEAIVVVQMDDEEATRRINAHRQGNADG